MLASPSANIPPVAAERRSWGGWMLALWAAAWTAFEFRSGGYAWHFFTEGEGILTGHSSISPLDLYAKDPRLQIGPFSFLVTEALTVFRLPSESGRSEGALAAQLLCLSLGALIVWIAYRLMCATRATQSDAEARSRRLTFYLAAAAFVPVWTYLADFTVHLDDALALALGVSALYALVRGHGVLGGLLIGLAVAAKPWALPFIALILVLEGHRKRAAALLAAGAVTAAAWLPFVLGSPGTVRAMHYQITNTLWSGLRVLGVHDAATPSWDRPTQMALGLAVASVAVLRGRWPWAILLVMSIRIAIDPGTNRYYTAGLVAGAILVDLVAGKSRWPWFTLAVLGPLHLARFVPALNPLHGYLLVAFAVAVLIGTVRSSPTPLPRSAPPGTLLPTETSSGTKTLQHLQKETANG